MIPRGSTFLVTKGHLSLTVVSAFEVGFLTTVCIAAGQRHQREDMGTASMGGRAHGHLRDDTSNIYMGCTWVLGTTITNFTPPYRSNTLHATNTIDFELASLWTGISGLRAGS